MNAKQIERWAPWVLLVITLVIWQGLCSLFNVSEFVFPSPLRIWEQLVEFRGTIAGHAWRTFWVTMAGFGIAIVVGVLMGFVIGSSRFAYAAVYPLMTGFNALPKAAFCAHPGGVVRHRHWSGDSDGVLDQLLPHHGEHCHGLGHT